MKTLLFILLSTVCYGQIDSASIANKWGKDHSSLIWIGDRTMIVTKDYFIVDLKSAKILKLDKCKYFTMIGMLPDSTKEYNLSLLATEIVPVVPVVVDIVDGELATFSNNWSNHGITTANGWYKNTIAYSNVAGSTVSYTFTGTKVELWAERTLTQGQGTVKIDQGAEIPVSFKGGNQLPALIYGSQPLAQGSHTITLKCSSGYVLLDYFKITR